ncbi:glycosyltransferase family 4 protein [Jiangella alkaliphila]|uniref:Glycosyltransferase involved in cell wall bisynthesis n=1 Tax=Jiangella alkaliphila TaxID=419479 RepID=A0A1H2M061_9ACTN|nr:glycosyltransferase family 4 protein [Jiangella alkaliphila]SDU86271.1 Glycosyltransferase involved in cell wall bisynthesis [Jiangella alkaliphila]
MVTDGKSARGTVHEAAKLQIADGALTQLLAQHRRNVELTAALAESQPLNQRVVRALRRARRNAWRLHRYPGDFRRALRPTVSGVKPAQADLDAVRSLMDAARHDEAIALAAALLPAKATDTEFLDLARNAFARAGALSLQLRATSALRELENTPSRESQERKVVGRIRETEAGWLPRVPAASPVTDPVDGRVLHLLKSAMPYRQTGYTMRSRYIIDAQRAAGLDPVVITAAGFPHEAGLEHPPATEVIGGVVHHYLEQPPASVLKGPVDQYLDAYASAAARRVPEIAPSLIHVHSGHRGYEAALVGVTLARAFRLPLVYEVRGFFESLWSRERPWNESGELYERRMATEARCMAAADAVVTLSESMRAQIIARGIAPQKVHVAPNGVDVTAFTPGARPSRLAERLGLEGKLVFGYISNLDHRREGHETLIRAAVELRARGVPAVALIVGDGDRRAELEKLAADERAGDSVLFTGRVPHDQVLDYYRSLDVFVVPRADERAARLVTPLKPFEAMAAGVPLVVAALDPLLEIIGAGDRGRSFPPGDASALADVLAELNLDPDTRRDLAKRGRDWVVAEHQWSANAARYRAIYAAVLGGR